ncbi:MAG: threonine ammonia-lyase, biosynthetic [Proteobacteria bacterium]|nr:threonine ammonia-lyase, biosynthetic [Pseudomonadota bacterium]
MTRTAADYLRRILNAKVYDVATESPLEPAHALSQRLGHTVLLKREDLQPVFSFKLRGAYNKMAHLSAAERARGVICASAGNHAQGVALAAQKLGCRAVIVMPLTTPQVKVDAVAARGGEVVLHGISYSDAYAHALTLQAAQGLTFVHPFDDPLVIAGQGTIAMEVLRQQQGPLHAVFVPIGGGGLIAGVAAYIKSVRPEVKVIGVQSEDSHAMADSLKAGRRVALADVGLFADGTAVKQVGRETFRLARMLVDEIILVDTDAVCAAIKDIFQDTRGIVEPSGALALAGLKAYAARRRTPAGQTLVAVTSGANMNFDRLGSVAERVGVGEAREALLAVTIPERRGAFRALCAVIGARSVTEFNYRISDTDAAHVFVGIAIKRPAEAAELVAHLHQAGFGALDISHDDLAREHVRHLVGGRSSLALDERLYRFIFPERPGALMRFLEAMAPEWNISLFHYRHQGMDHGRVLVGMQVPTRDRAAFKAFLSRLNYPCVEETRNPAYRLFLR